MEGLMTIANILAGLLGVYSLLIWVRIMLTWLRIPGGFPDSGFFRFLRRAVDPYLSLFSPMRSLRRSHFDLTPLLALAVLSVAQSILRLFSLYGKLTPLMVLATIVRTFWSFIVSPLFWFFFIILVIRLVFCYRQSPSSITFISMLDSMDSGILDFVQNLFYGRKLVNDRTVVWTSVIFILLCYLALKFLLNRLMGIWVHP